MSKVSPPSSKAAARATKSATAGSSSGLSSAKGKLPMPLIIGVVFFLGLVFTVLFMVFGGGNSEPVEQSVEVVVPQSDELNTGSRDVPTIPIDETPVDPLMDDATVVVDPFASPEPINAVTEEAITSAIKSDPSYTEGVGLLMPDGTMFGENTVDFNALKKEIGAPVYADLSSIMIMQSGAEGDVWMFNDINSGNGPIPLASQEAKGKAMAFAVQSANKHLQDVKARYSQPVAPVQAQVNPNAQQVANQQVVEPVQRVVEVSTINDEERQLLNSIVQELRIQNKNTKDELKAAKAERASVEKELVQLRQRIEDNPALKNVVRATMLPKSTGYKLDAVMNDKIFLRNIKNDEIVIVQQGQAIPSTSYNISSADMDTGIVLVTQAK